MHDPSVNVGLSVARLLLRTLPVLVLLGIGGSLQLAAAETPEDQPRRDRVERRLYTGMWTVHFRDRERGIDSNHLLGVSWGRYYAGTFVNSYDRRAYTAGVQGTMVRWTPGAVGLGVGYRAGLVTGYDERFVPIARITPVLPLVQPRVNFDVRRIGVEFTYSGVIASAAMNYRF